MSIKQRDSEWDVRTWTPAEMREHAATYGGGEAFDRDVLEALADERERADAAEALSAARAATLTRCRLLAEFWAERGGYAKGVYSRDLLNELNGPRFSVPKRVLDGGAK